MSGRKSREGDIPLDLEMFPGRMALGTVPDDSKNKVVRSTMKKLVVGALCVVLPFISSCENSFFFRPTEKANTVYHVSMRVISTGSVDYRGDKELIQKIKASGTKLPIQIRKEQVTVMTTETGPKIENGVIPFTTRIDSVYSIQFINGSLQDRDANAGLDTSFRMTGFYKNDTAKVEDVEGRNVTPEIRKMMKSVVRQLTEAVRFPDRSLKIGDEFTRTVPLNMPMGKLGDIQMEITTEYTLEKLSSRYAYFGLVQKLGLSSDVDSTNLSGSGNGAGELVFGKTAGRVIRLHTKIEIDMQVKIGPVKLVTVADTDTELQTTVTSR